MEFEFDVPKSQANKRKHGLDFVEAQALWEDSELLEIPLKSADEQRLLVIGLIGSKHWTAIITYRQTHVSIISVRRSRDDERELYES